MVWKHKDTCCHTVFCVFLCKSDKPMRVRAQNFSEILTEQFPVIYKRPLLSKCQSKLKNIISTVSAGHGMKDKDVHLFWLDSNLNVEFTL